MIFEQLQEFTKTGCFRFENGILSNHYIESLIKNLLITPTSHQLYLNHVGLSLPLKANFQEPIIGPVTSKEYVRNWVETYPTHVLYQWSIPPGGMVINHDFSERIEFEGTPPLVEKLLELLYSSTNWKVIELNDIRLDWQERSCSLRWKPNNFVKVLERNRHLIRLSCDLSMSYDNSFKELMEVIAKHPNLQELNLLATILSENDYHALNELLDINYTIATIITKPPEDSYLLEMYNALQTRLSASPIARFINKQFTPEKLLALAELGLEPGNHRLFNLLLKRPASLPTITGREKQADYARLPTVYKLNRRLWENNESLWHLNLDKQLRQKTKK